MNNVGVYITRSIITHLFPVEPGDLVIMEPECITFACICV